jgi:hypothetical protein
MQKERKEVKILQLSSLGTSLIGEVSVEVCHPNSQISSIEIPSPFVEVLVGELNRLNSLKTVSLNASGVSFL